MVRIRMQRFGRTKRPFYRIAAIDQRKRRNGPVLENLGWYNPIEKDTAKQVHINEERVKHWISQGAQPTDTVRDFLAKRKLIDVKAWEADREFDRKMVEANKVKADAAAAAAAEAKK